MYLVKVKAKERIEWVSQFSVLTRERCLVGDLIFFFLNF